jgi:hypothetical protein
MDLLRSILTKKLKRQKKEAELDPEDVLIADLLKK